MNQAAIEALKSYMRIAEEVDPYVIIFDGKIRKTVRGKCMFTSLSTAKNALRSMLVGIPACTKFAESLRKPTDTYRFDPIKALMDAMIQDGSIVIKRLSKVISCTTQIS